MITGKKEAPFACPSCGGDDIDMAYDVDWSGPECICRATCFTCDAIWDDIYVYDRREVFDYGRVTEEATNDHE